MSMENQTKTIRLLYPQWQGGNIARWITEVNDPALASRGYFLGAQLLNFLAPDSGQKTCTVPVATEAGERETTDGVLDREAIIAQTKAALDILASEAPDRIVTLGGECSVSVVPFTYLWKKYKGDVAVVWIDAHPDITLPGDAYSGYHAMAVTACMGLGDRRIVSQLPAQIDPARILLVGLRDWERDEIRERQRQHGIEYLAPEGCTDGQLPGAGVAGAVRCLESGGALRHGRARPGRNHSRRGGSARRDAHCGDSAADRRHCPSQRLGGLDRG